MNKSAAEDRHLLPGIHPVSEAIAAGYSLHRVLIAKGAASERIEELIARCKERSIQFRFVERSELDTLSKGVRHQDIIGELKHGPRMVHGLAELIHGSTDRYFLVILDGITDPHNVGAIIRSARYFGAAGVVVEEHNCAPLTETVHRVSAGASLLVPFWRCEKLSGALAQITESGIHLIAAQGAAEARSLESYHFPERCAVVFVAEGPGIRPHVLRSVDDTVMIPSYTGFDSLNVNAACAVFLSALRREWSLAVSH